jgi:uncharacterized protein (TIGR02246 family)
MRPERVSRPRRIAALWLLPLIACTTGGGKMDAQRLQDFGTRYAAAWSSHDAAAVASFFEENGSLTVNDGEPAVGRDAIAGVAQGFITAFPNLVVKMDSLRTRDGTVEFHWTFTGTNTGPGGTGNPVDFSGYEEWTLGQDDLVAVSKGHFDQAEYQRQLEANGSEP